MFVSGQDVVELIGYEVSVDLAQAHLNKVTAYARAYTRGRGFTEDGEPETDDLAAVVVTVTARLIAEDTSTGQFNAFKGWTLADLLVLNRYRVRAQ